MKKSFSTLIIAFAISMSVNAQDVGQMWIGGSAGFSVTSVKGGEDYVNAKIIPEIGYVMSDKIGIGIKLGYQQTELNMDGLLSNPDYSPGKTTGFIVNPFLRFSVLKGNIGGLFVDGGLGYSYAKNKTSDVKVHGAEVGFRPGVSINVSSKVALTAKFGFLGYEYVKAGDHIKIHNYGFDFNLDQALLGVNFVF